MDIALEVVQWVVIVVLGLLSSFEYFFIANLMEQIDLLSDRFLRLLNDQRPQTPNHSLERIRSWRGDVRLKSKALEWRSLPHFLPHMLWQYKELMRHHSFRALLRRILNIQRLKTEHHFRDYTYRKNNNKKLKG